MSTHPRALAAAEAAKQRAEERALMKAYIADLTAKGVRFLEIHPHNTKGRIASMTLAYYKDRHNVFAVANALCHPDDQFDKIRGRALAGTRLVDGSIIALRKPSHVGLTDAQWLDFKFREF